MIGAEANAMRPSEKSVPGSTMNGQRIAMTNQRRLSTPSVYGEIPEKGGPIRVGSVQAQLARKGVIQPYLSVGRWVLLASALLCLNLAAQTVTIPGAVVAPVPYRTFTDATGLPLSGGTVCTYRAGTNTPLATYTDSTGTVQNPLCVPLNASGQAAIWIGAGPYKFVVNDSSGVTQWTQDNVMDASFNFLKSVQAVGSAPFITYVAPGTGAGTQSVYAALSRQIDILDYQVTGSGDESAKIQNALNQAATLAQGNGNATVTCNGGGPYTVKNISVPAGVTLAAKGCTFHPADTTSPMFVVQPNAKIDGINIDASGTSSYTGSAIQLTGANYTDAQVTSVSHFNVKLPLAGGTCLDLTAHDVVGESIAFPRFQDGACYGGQYGILLQGLSTTYNVARGFVNDAKFVNIESKSAQKCIYLKSLNGQVAANQFVNVSCQYGQSTSDVPVTLNCSSCTSAPPSSPITDNQFINLNLWDYSDAGASLIVTDTDTQNNVFQGYNTSATTDNGTNNQFWDLRALGFFPWKYNVVAGFSLTAGNGFGYYLKNSGTSDTWSMTSLNSVFAFNKNGTPFLNFDPTAGANIIDQAGLGLHTGDGGAYSLANSVSGKNWFVQSSGADLNIVDFGNGIPFTFNVSGNKSPVSLMIGPSGTPLKQVTKYSAAITPSAVPANSCLDQSFTVTGIQAGDVVMAVNAPGNPLVSLSARTAGVNTVAMTMCNPTLAPVTPLSGTYVFVTNNF